MLEDFSLKVVAELAPPEGGCGLGAIRGGAAGAGNWQIAEGDQRSDEDDDKKPGLGLKPGIGPDGLPQMVPDWRQQQANIDFHAFGTHAQNARRADQLYREALSSGDLRRLGTYTHFLQDEFSHYAFAGDPTLGHGGHVGHAVDHTTFNPD
jgi:hypothetical protein